jgi:hypothetical protein
MTEPIEFFFRLRLADRLACGRACPPLGALSRKDRGLAAAAARGDRHAGDGLAAPAPNSCVYQNLNASVLVMKSAKDAARTYMMSPIH